MNLTDSTYLLKNILVSELPQASARNRLWTRKLAEVSDLDALLSVKIAKEIVHTLSSRPFVLLVPREAIALYTEVQLQKMGIVRLKVPGIFRYWAAKIVPTEILFRKKKQKKGQPDENAAQSLDLRKGWLELLPYEVRFITVLKLGGVPSSHLVIRAAAYLEHLRLATEHDIMRIGNEEAWKKASRKERAKLDYCSIAAFDRILIIGLLRKHFLELTPKAEYQFHQSDGHVSEATPHALHRLIFAVSRQNRYRFFPTSSGA
jgi:hypothetical protein